MRYFIRPCENADERGCWELIDSVNDERKAVTGRGLYDLLKLTRVMNLNFDKDGRSVPASERETSNGELGNLRARAVLAEARA